MTDLSVTEARFVACLPYVLAQECPYPNNWTNIANFSNDKHDAGGKTFAGIIQREYDVWRKAQCEPCRDVRELTQAEGYEIYLTSYWLPHCDDLPAGLDLCFFDTSVNMGTAEATKILQVVLGVENDGMWGPKTQAALGGEKEGLPVLINAFSLRRETVYRQMRGFQYFGADWIRRAQEIGAEALRMAASAVVVA